MKFGYAILYVEDVEATLDFYERAFGLKRKMLYKKDDGNAYGELDTGNTLLAFAAKAFVGTHFPISVQNASPETDAPPVEFAFVTENVKAAFDKATAEGAVPAQSPELKPWGQTVGYVRDNNGFIVELCSPMG